jgi:hypothetical protein
MRHFKAQDFDYVENVCYVMLNQNYKNEVDNTRQIDISKSIIKQDS